MAADTQVQQLLAHAEWLSRLAARLLDRDENAQDLLQQTWLAAVASPPDPDRPPRPWLSTVFRNFVRRARRDRRVRARYEEVNSAAAETAVNTAADPVSPERLLEAAELQRVLAERVLALEEPYRTTVLLRFYQGEEPTEIARRTGVPAGTVRWRLNEAIRRLRAALDDRQDARDWRRALLPFVVGRESGRLRAMMKGAIAMSTKAKVGTAVAVALVAAASWNLYVRSSGAKVTATSVAHSNSAGQIGTAAAPRESPSAATAKTAASRAPTPPKLLIAPHSGPSTEAVPDQASLDRDQVRRAIRRVVPAISQCYEKLAETNPSASGRLVVRFTVVDASGTGRISEASVVPKEGTGGGPELVHPLTEQCIVNALAGAIFPSPGAPVVVTYPFTFASKETRDVIPGSARIEPAP